MIKAYKTAILLIEFDGDKTFALTGQSEVATELDNRSPQARLVLLLLHFPKLRCACFNGRGCRGGGGDGLLPPARGHMVMLHSYKSGEFAA